MIVKRNFNPVKILSYIWKELLFSFIWAVVIWYVYAVVGISALAINFTPIGVVGSALAIFVAFRNNSAYGRWWEARQIWGRLISYSRVFARMVINFVDSEKAQASEDVDPQVFDTYKREMVSRQIAFAHALRLHLRGQEDWEEIKHLLAEEEWRQLQSVNNKPNMILQQQGNRVREGQGEKMLQWFHSFQIEGALAQFGDYQGASERIKETPLPRQYDFFTRLFVIFFVILLPLGLLSLFHQSPTLTWAIIPFSVLISTIFTIMEKTGKANEDPFENKVTDIPLTTMCNSIERDLKEQLGEMDIPEKIKPVQGYLY